MLKTAITFEVTNGLALAEHALLTIGLPAPAEFNRRSEDIAPHHLEMNWITTESGLEARWVVRSGEAGAPTRSAEVTARL